MNPIVNPRPTSNDVATVLRTTPRINLTTYIAIIPVITLSPETPMQPRPIAIDVRRTLGVSAASAHAWTASVTIGDPIAPATATASATSTACAPDGALSNLVYTLGDMCREGSITAREMSLAVDRVRTRSAQISESCEREVA